MQIALFGEAEKGSFTTLFHFTGLPTLAETLGGPPAESQGIPLAIQALLFECEVVYIRVREEGFSLADYHQGLRLLRAYKQPLAAIALPGVGDPTLIGAAAAHALLLTTERDLHDYIHS